MSKRISEHDHLQQYLLWDPESWSEMICWLKPESGLKVGSTLTLKEMPDRVWTVKHVYDGTFCLPRDIKRGWNNNI